MLRCTLPLLVFVAALGIGACAGPTTEEALSETDVSDVQISSAVVVANPNATRVAEVFDDRIVLPAAGNERLTTMTAGTIFVGARGATTSKNPDGFLRRVTAVSASGGEITIATTPATLTDAVVRGAVRASSGARPFDNSELASNKVGTMDIDLSGQSLFENQDVVQGRTFTESIRFEKARFTSSPTVDVDVRIEAGKVSRFTAKVEGNLDASIKAIARVTADGDSDDAMLAELREKKHEVTKVLFASKRIPLPTFSVGNVPVSPSVKFTLTLRCGLAFGGPLVATAGVEAKSYLRLGGVNTNGTWGNPVQSQFDIEPSLDIERAGAVDAVCALEADAELFAYGISGVTMSVAPYVDFGIAKHQGSGQGANASLLRYHAEAGANGSFRGTDVFGVADFDRAPVASWKGTALSGIAR